MGGEKGKVRGTRDECEAGRRGYPLGSGGLNWLQFLKKSAQAVQLSGLGELEPLGGGQQQLRSPFMFLRRPWCTGAGWHQDPTCVGMSHVALMAGGEEGSEAWVLTPDAWKGLQAHCKAPGTESGLLA